MFLVKTARLQRPRNSGPKIRRYLSQSHCVKCGTCCKETEKLVVVPQDRNFDMVLSAVSSRNPREKTISIASGGFELISGDKGCQFLEMKEEKGAVLHTCPIYLHRPMMCTIFPFRPMYIYSIEDGTHREGPKMVLSSACPPIKELLDNGVQYVRLGDMVHGTNILTDNFVAASLGNIFLLRNFFSTEEHFLVRERRVIFPII